MSALRGHSLQQTQGRQQQKLKRTVSRKMGKNILLFHVLRLSKVKRAEDNFFKNPKTQTYQFSRTISATKIRE